MRSEAPDTDKAVIADLVDGLYDSVASIADISRNLRTGEITLDGGTTVIDAHVDAINLILDRLDDI